MMNRQRLRMWNSIVWGVAILACAVVLEGEDGSVLLGILLILICGAAGSDALLVRAIPDTSEDSPKSGPGGVRQ